MKTILFLALLILVITISINDVFADHNEVTVIPAPGSGAPGCETTAAGCYIPKSASVAVGGKVIFSNTDTAAHTFTAGTAADGPTGVFDTSLVIAGSSYEWIATTVGDFPYYCMVHPWMEGMIIVIDDENATVPNPPVILSTVGSNTKVMLSWSKPYHGGYSITDYIIKYSKNNMDWNVFDDGVNTDTSVTVTGLTNKKLYYFTIQAVNRIGSSIQSSSMSATPIAIPDAPLNLSAISGDYQITLSWTEPNNAGFKIRDYVIKFGTDQNNLNTFSDGVNRKTSVTMNGLDSGKLYLFQVYAVNSKGNGIPAMINAFAYGPNTIYPSPGSGAPGCETTPEGCFIPKEVTIDVGESIMFYNIDTAAHTFTAGTAADGPSGAFDSSLVIAGSSYEWTATRSGQVPYYCMVHPWMAGTITVND